MKNISLITRQGTMNYITYGDKNKPAIVMLHGLAGTGCYSFEELAHHLKDQFHLIVPDMPGHGKTEAFPQAKDYLFSNLADWLLEILPLIVQKPFYMIGHSWGADTALHFTRHFPENVQGLILLDGAFTFPQNQPEMIFEHAYAGWSDYMNRSVFHSVSDVFKEYKGYTQNWNSQKEQYVRSIIQKTANGQYELIASKFTVLSIIQAFFEEPFADAYPHIKVPTLLIHADLPPDLNEARAQGIRQLRSAVDDVTITKIPGSSHMLQWDFPDQTAQTIAGWIKDSSKKRSSE